MSFLRAKSGGPGWRPGTESPQFAALCYRVRRGTTEVLLITSRDTGRWVIPKGWPIEGASPEESALREAYEEAGVRGRITGGGIGEYRYLKGLDDDKTVPCRVEVFPLRVDRLVRDFPEKGQRKLKWFKPVKAAPKVDEPELQAILEGFTAPD